MYRFFAALCVVLCPLSAWAETFSCSTGDAACLVASITQANANGKKNTINLEAGTYTLADVGDVPLDAESSLPQITSTLTIQGRGAGVTIIEPSHAPSGGVRPFVVAADGDLTLLGLTVRNGRGTGDVGDGGALANYGGVVTIGVRSLATTVRSPAAVASSAKAAQ
jgi:hypothetical protein